MLIVFGQRFYGEAEQVSNGWTVETKFFHLYFLPITPMESYLVTRREGEAVFGFPISLSFKSVLAGYLRVWMLLVLPVTVLAALITVVVTERLGPGSAIAIGIALGAGAITYWAYRSRWINDASDRREAELMDVARVMQGLMPVAPGSRGFGVLPVAEGRSQGSGLPPT